MMWLLKVPVALTHSTSQLKILHSENLSEISDRREGETREKDREDRGFYQGV